MPNFSQRYNYSSIDFELEVEYLSKTARIGIWNVIYESRNNLFHPDSIGLAEHLSKRLWSDYLNQPLDDQPGYSDLQQIVKNLIIKSSWNKVFDLLEAIFKYWDEFVQHNIFAVRDDLTEFVESIVRCFKVRHIGYSVIALQITPIQSEAEVEEINEAAKNLQYLPGAHQSLARAMHHLSNRDNPDYINSVKESISAVEAVLKEVSGKNSLSENIDELKKKGVVVHPALQKSMKTMYGWASQVARHGTPTGSVIDFPLAKWTLITCTAFINYLIHQKDYPMQ